MMQERGADGLSSWISTSVIAGGHLEDESG